MKIGYLILAIALAGCSNQTVTTPKAAAAGSGQICATGGPVNPAAVNNRTLPIVGNENNVVGITVGCGYVNQPCVSVTICAPGSNGATSCQTIPNLLLDTGSFGLRIFDNATTSLGGTISTAALTAIGSLYECVSYGDGSYQWGKVMKADVTMGTQVASNVPIHIVEANPTSQVPNVPAACINQQGSPGSADVSIPGTYNGILGVGLFAKDCGATCAASANNSVYFSCTGNSCTGSTASLANQVTNPVYLMPAGYNNGVIVQLNNVPNAGAASSTGYLVMGIGTVTNNTPPNSVVTYQADSYGNIKTNFSGQTYNTSFIDSGSNGLFFPNSCLSTDLSGFYAPNPSLGFSSSISSSSGTNTTTALFNVASLVGSSNRVFNNLGGGAFGYFDWGLPFFLGRTVYFGIETKTSVLGTGPYYAF